MSNRNGVGIFFHHLTHIIELYAIYNSIVVANHIITVQHPVLCTAQRQGSAVDNITRPQR